MLVLPSKTRISQPALAIIKPEYRDGLQISSPLAGNLQNNILPSGVSVTNSGATAAVTRDLKGFNCNGTSNYISYGDAFYSDVLTLLITWIPADAGDANPRSIVVKRNSSGTTNSGINELSLTYTSTGIYYAAWNSSGIVICNPGFSTSIAPGKSYHICVVHRGAGGIVSLWVNGSEVTGTISASAINNTTNHLQIAARTTDNDNRWGKGIFTNFHAWSIARTDGLELSKNPWQIFQPDRRSIFLPATSVTLSYLRPSADISTGSWTPSTGTTLYETLDEVSASDADYIQTSTASSCEIRLAAGATPLTKTNHTLKYNLLAGSGTITVKLVQGTTVKKTWNHTLTGSTQQISNTLTEAEANTITDYSDLRVRFET